MNPFERIKDYRSALLLQIKDTLVKPSDTLTYEEHYKTLLTFLKLLEEDLKNSEYEYVLEQYNNGSDKATYCQYHGMTMQGCTLGENLLLFQPLFTDNTRLGAPDMDSLIDALTALKEAGRFSEDVLVIPPGINILKARLADTTAPDSDNVITAEQIAKQIHVQEELAKYERMTDESEDSDDDYFDDDSMDREVDSPMTEEPYGFLGFDKFVSDKMGRYTNYDSTDSLPF